MGKCINTRFNRMLYAYELDMLDEKSREELEIHLLECPYCNNEARHMKKAAQLLRDDMDLREQISNMAESHEKIDEIRAQGVRVSHAAYYFSGKTTPTKFENLTEVLEIAKADGLTLYISNGSPDYHFLTVSGLIQIWFYPPEGRVSMIQIF